MFTKGQEVKVTKDVIGWSDIEVSGSPAYPLYARVTHVFSDETVHVAYEVTTRNGHTFTDHAILGFDEVAPA